MYKIYSRDNCGYCVKAKTLLESRGMAYEIIDASSHKDELVQLVIDSGNPAPRTVPQIFQDGRYIGGYNELSKHIR